MIAVVSASHYRHPLADDTMLPSLNDQLQQVCREPPRRIDRFVQLALLGSGRCAAGQALAPDCGVYLGSGFGPMSNNISTQQQLIRDQQIPKPFNFINTLGNSAGFYVAHNLDLSGQNFFISRPAASFTAALSVAIADLIAGVGAQALVGLVDEVTLPLSEHRQRRGLATDVIPAEASHWLLLQAGGSSAITIELTRYADFRDLENAISATWRKGDRLHCTLDTEIEFAAGLQQKFPDAGKRSPVVEDHDSPEAAWLTEFASQRIDHNLFVVSGAGQRGWLLIHCRA